MKTKLFSMLGLALFLTVSCRQHDFRELTLHVPDMHNQASVQIVMQALSRGPGIKPNSVLLDPDKRIVRLTYDSLLSADKNFEYLVAEAGFAVNGIPANEKARAALPLEAQR